MILLKWFSHTLHLRNEVMPSLIAIFSFHHLKLFATSNCCLLTMPIFLAKCVVMFSLAPIVLMDDSMPDHSNKHLKFCISINSKFSRLTPLIFHRDGIGKKLLHKSYQHAHFHLTKSSLLFIISRRKCFEILYIWLITTSYVSNSCEYALSLSNLPVWKRYILCCNDYLHSQSALMHMHN
jgi:hypothetical protein